MDELGKSFPAAEGLVDAENAGKNQRSNENCLNCGTPLTDTFCAHCGQKDIPRRQTLGELFSNFISSFWSYEGKFFLTSKYLITRPGFLATEYNAGRRESYYHPARMYVFISFVFFLLLFSLPDTDADEEEEEEAKKEMTSEDLRDLKESLKEAGLTSSRYYNDSIWSEIQKDLEKEAKADSAKGKKKSKRNFSLNGSEYKSLAEYDSIQNALPEDKRDGWFERRLNHRSIELNNRYKDGKDFSDDFGQAFKDNFSKVLFYLLPFFALLLKLLYIRRDYFYSEHLVLSIYYYNFFYLGGSVYLLVDQIPVVQEFTWVIGLWIYFYFLFAMKRVYQQSWKKTIAKFVLFSFAFMVLMSIGLTISVLAILMML